MSEGMRVFLKEYEQVRIYVHERSGRFHAEIGGQELVRPTLAELEELIRRWKKPVRALWFPAGVGVETLLPDPVELNIVGGDERRWLTADGGELRRAAGRVVRHNGPRISNANATLPGLRQKVMAVLVEWEQWLDTMPVLTRTDTGWDEA